MGKQVLVLFEMWQPRERTHPESSWSHSRDFTKIERFSFILEGSTLLCGCHTALRQNLCMQRFPFEFASKMRGLHPMMSREANDECRASWVETPNFVSWASAAATATHHCCNSHVANLNALRNEDNSTPLCCTELFITHHAQFSAER